MAGYQECWRSYVTPIVYLLILLWAIRLTYNLYSKNGGYVGGGHMNMYEMQPMQIHPLSEQFRNTDLDLALAGVQVKEEGVSFEIQFGAAIYLNQGNRSIFLKYMKEILREVLMTKDLPINNITIQLELQVTQGDYKILGNISTTDMYPKVIIDKFAQKLTSGAIREKFISHAGVQNLLRQVSGQFLEMQQGNSSLVETMRYIIKGIPSASQVYLMSQNQLIDEVRTALQRTQQQLMQDLIDMENLEQDADSYRKKLYILQQKIIIAEQKVIDKENELNNTIEDSGQYIADMKRKNVEQAEREKGLILEQVKLQKEVKELKDQYQYLKKEADVQKQKILHLEEQLKKSKSKENSDSKNYQTTQLEFQKLQQEISFLTNQQTKFQNMVLNVAISTEIIAKKFKGSDTDNIFDILQNLKELENNSKEIKEKISKNQEQIKIKKELLDWQDKQINISNLNIEEWQLELDNLNGKYNILKSKLIETDEETENKERLIRDLKREVSFLKEDLNESLSEVEEKIWQWKQQRSIYSSYRELFNMMNFFTGQFIEKHDEIKKEEETEGTESYNSITINETRYVKTTYSKNKTHVL